MAGRMEASFLTGSKSCHCISLLCTELNLNSREMVSVLIPPPSPLLPLPSPSSPILWSCPWQASAPAGGLPRSIWGEGERKGPTQSPNHLSGRRSQGWDSGNSVLHCIGHRRLAALTVSVHHAPCLALFDEQCIMTGACEVCILPSLLPALLIAWQAGAMLGDAFLHQLPHAFCESDPN